MEAPALEAIGDSENTTDEKVPEVSGKKRSLEEAEATDIANEQENQEEEEEKPTRRRSKRRRTTKPKQPIVTRTRKKKAAKKTVSKKKTPKKTKTSKKKKTTARKSSRKRKGKQAQADPEPEAEAEAETGEAEGEAQEPEPMDVDATGEEQNENLEEEKKEAAKPKGKGKRGGGRRKSARGSKKNEVDELKEEIASLKEELEAVKSAKAKEAENAYVLPNILSDINDEIIENIKGKKDEDADVEMNDMSSNEGKCDEINEQLNEHESRVNTWKSNLKELNELKETEEASLNANVEDIAVSGKDLFEKTQEYQSLINEHHNQLENISKYAEELLNSRQFLFNNFHEYEKQVNTERDAHEGSNLDYVRTQSEREQREIEFKQAFEAVKDLIEKENALNVERFESKAKLQLIQSKLEKYQASIDKYNNVRREYAAYETETNNVMPVIKQFVQLQWKAFESKWYHWSNEDLVYWLKQTFIWFKYQFADKKSIKNMIKAMQKASIDGSKLDELSKSDFQALGIDDHQNRSEMFDAIQQLTSKYRKPSARPSVERVDLTGDDADENAATPPPEGQTLGEVVMIQGLAVPKEYVCPISGTIMEDPVMAFDKTIYEKKNIVAWLQENGCSPITGERIDELDSGDLEMMLFPQVQLKQKIVAFKSANHMQ